MAIAIYFHPKSMNLEAYEAIQRKLDEAGAGSPAGQIHHSCFGEDGALMVYDIWESQEAFDEFGKTLMPILGEVGVDPGQPAIMPVHRVEQESRTA
jgi:hypothetical protein